MNLSNEISGNALMLETIFDHTHFMIAYLDKDFNFIGVNKAYAKKSNKTPDFFVGKNHFDMYPHKGNEEIFKNVVNTGKPYFAYSMPLEHPELGITYWDWVIKPVKEDNEVTGILLSLTDVTDYKRNEDTICENQREFLDKLVESRAHDLLANQEESKNPSLETASLEIECLNQQINELKKTNEEFKEIISKYKISEKEREESVEKQVNEIIEKQVAAEELLDVKNLEVKKKDQKIAELEETNNKFKEIISKYEDSKIENEKFIKNLVETHAKELENIKKNGTTFENLNENIIDNVSDAIIVMDSKLRIKMWNDAAQKIYGWKDDEIIGKIAYQVFKSKENPIERLKSLEYLRNNEYLHSKFIHYHKDGKPLNIESTITAKHGDTGRAVEYTYINHDVSELKNTEELLDSSNLKIEGLNRKVTELEKVNHEFKEILSKYENSEKLFEKRVNEALRKQKEAKELLEAKKVRVEELNQNIIQLENTNEELSIHISKLEDSVESQKNIYEKQMKKLADDLNHSNEEFQQFAYVTSHDLQEPLRTIASFTQLLAKRYKNKIDEDSDEFMDYIVDASTRMQGMIKDLLQYSRVVSRGKIFKPTNTEEIIEYTISSLKTLIGDNDAEVNYDKLPKVNADSAQLLQLFQNLVENGIKFRQFAVQPKIHISCKEQGNEYVFSVADNGIGIEEQYSDRIFTIFQRLHTKEEYEGSGIGLSLAKRIVERHGGRIWVESEPDIGSTFYFTLPLDYTWKI
ncbi:ATP-binding protein [Methanobacterium sp.]|uniref:PAS domain-containing sensor histidine kinase n=1 Tax=Methanobacterium sp. TaxID=2164 RepID=UPI003C7926AA